jgi:K+-sensing histidine kinase KdpD
VLDNLLVNADRYSPHDAPIEIQVAPGARGTIVTRVIDHGSGVPDEMRDRIFDRFVRGEEPAPTEGTGLGLPIVKGIVEAHAGRVWLDDPTSDGGAVFAFTLPAEPTEHTQVTPAATAPQTAP